MFSKYKNKKTPFIIAEVGANHQGSLDCAREYVKIYASMGANAIKFQIRDNDYLFSKKALKRTYDNRNSFGFTYGEHRKYLELNLSDYKILKKDCKKYGVCFGVTAFDENSLKKIIQLKPDFIKVASFDIGNLGFLTKISKSDLPIIISSGGANLDIIKNSIDILSKNSSNEIALLHCVSQYPCLAENLSLINIQKLDHIFGDIVTVGLSDHFNGTLSGPIGWMNGAIIFEKHVTLNRSWPGSDHSFALEPDGFRKFVRDIKRTKMMLIPQDVKSLGKEKIFEKLGKSIAANIDIKKGEVLNLKNIRGVIFDKSESSHKSLIPIREVYKFLKRKVARDIKQGEPVFFEDISNLK